MDKSLAKCFREVFEELEKGEFFHGREIRNATVIKYYKTTGNNADPYVDTILRYLRMNYPNRYELVDRHDSLYRKLY